MEMGISVKVRRQLPGTVVASGKILLTLGIAIALFLQPIMAAETKGKDDRHTGGAVASKETEISKMEIGILDYTNQERRSRGMVPLRLSPALTFLARRHSSHMCSGGTLAHESEAFPAGWRRFAQRMDMVGVRIAAENVAYYSLLKTPEAWARAVTKLWMESPHHRKNILNPEFRYVGVGIIVCKNAIVYAAQVLAAETGRLPDRSAQ
jgi:uncharacterized protein YkwD